MRRILVLMMLAALCGCAAPSIDRAPPADGSQSPDTVATSNDAVADTTVTP